MQEFHSPVYLNTNLFDSEESVSYICEQENIVFLIIESDKEK